MYTPPENDYHIYPFNLSFAYTLNQLVNVKEK